MSEGNIGEEDLQAYVDGRLDALRSAHVELYLEQNLDAAARIASYIQQTHDLRAALKSAAGPDFAAVAAPRRAVPGRISSRALWRAAAAAVLLGFFIGGGGGWMARGHVMPAQLGGIPALTAEAVANHLVFTQDHGRPVELAANKQADLVRWLSKRLNTPVIVPDLTEAGYQFMGGRLAATDHGPAAMLMYVNATGQRMTVFTRPMPRDRRDIRTMPISADGVSGFAWICEGHGYMVLQTQDAANLRSVADSVRHQVDPS